jgi:hypothetical protein
MLQVLLRARRLIRKGWCKGHAAEDKDGNRLNRSCEPGVARVCLSSGIEKATRQLKGSYLVAEEAHRLVRKAIEASRNRKDFTHGDLDVVVRYNDHRKRRKRDILRVLDKAIKACRRARDTS